GPEADSDPVGGGARALAAADADAFAFSRIPNNQKRGSTVGAYLDPASSSDASLAVRGATVLKYREDQQRVTDRGITSLLERVGVRVGDRSA
ncbi:MAG: hypothetical protein ACPGSH_00750, partial [Ilumatobacteraceae bacterium]